MQRSMAPTSFSHHTHTHTCIPAISVIQAVVREKLREPGATACSHRELPSIHTVPRNTSLQSGSVPSPYWYHKPEEWRIPDRWIYLTAVVSAVLLATVKAVGLHHCAMTTTGAPTKTRDASLLAVHSSLMTLRIPCTGLFASSLFSACQLLASIQGKLGDLGPGG